VSGLAAWLATPRFKAGIVGNDPVGTDARRHLSVSTGQVSSGVAFAPRTTAFGSFGGRVGCDSTDGAPIGATSESASSTDRNQFNRSSA
jgi:hypothetical protein